jgi:uncharacterized protein involved in exopolysaccharide biosynthesis
MQINDKSPTLRDFLYLLFKYKWTIVIFTSASILIAIVYNEMYLPKYKAASKVLIKIGRENATPEAGVVRPSSMITTMKPLAIINSEIELLRGRHMIEKLMETMGDEILNPPKVEPKTIWEKIKSYIKKKVSYLYDLIYTMLWKLGLKKKLSPREKTIL